VSEKKRSSRLAAALVALALLAAACGSGNGDGDAAADGTTTVRVAVSNYIEPYLVPLLADRLGEFERENLDVEFQVVPATDGLTLLSTGEVNVQIAAFRANFFNAASLGLPVAAVAHTWNEDPSEQGMWVRNELLLPDGTIDPARIEGMRVCLGPSGGLDSTSVYDFYHWLRENGGSIDDVEVVTLGSAADMLTALQSGAIDAAGLLTPFWVEAQDIAKRVTGVTGPRSSAYIINTDWAGDNPEVATAFFRALSRTIDENLTGDYKSDPEMVDTIADIMEVEPEIVAQSPSLGYDPELPLDTDVAEGLQDIWLEIGTILDYTEPLDIDDIVYRDPIEDLDSTG
jgi:NitT/TauT family transport system substrate-binding protein